MWKTSLDSKDEVRICDFDVSKEAEKLLWFDVAFDSDRLVTAVGNGLWLYDLNKMDDGGDCIYRPKSPSRLMSFASITSDGRQIIGGLRFPDRYAVLWIDVETRESRILCEHSWWVNHIHFSPHQPAWGRFLSRGSL